MNINDLVCIKDKDKLILGYIEQIYTEKFGFVREYAVRSILEFGDIIEYNPRNIYYTYLYIKAKDVFKENMIDDYLADLSKDYPNLSLQLQELANE